MNVIALINQKGGVGKSTTTLALASGLTLKGFKVLCIDLDAQGNLSHTMRIDNTGVTGFNSMDVIEGKITAITAIQHTEQGDIIAGSPALTGSDINIRGPGKEFRLREALKSIKYDFVVIDTPPSLGILLVNALTASTGCIIPAQADIYSLEGISRLYNTLQAVKKHTNPSLEIFGILLTRFNRRAIISREIAEMIEHTAGQLNTKLYKARIRENTSIKESQAVRQSIFTYAPKSNAAKDYSEFIEEFLRQIS